jgi:uncharacterized protein YqeY
MATAGSQTRARLLDEMKACMKSGQKDRLGVVRMLITEIKNAEINDQITQGRERTEDECLTIVSAYHKSLTKSLAEFPPEKHPPIRAELAIVEDFLPKQLSAPDLDAHIKRVLASAPDRQFGPLMKTLQTELKGQVSGQTLSAALKAALES